MGKLFSGVVKIGIGVALFIVGWKSHKVYATIPEDCDYDYDHNCGKDDWGEVDDSAEEKDPEMFEEE